MNKPKQTTDKMKVEKNKVVSLTYELIVDGALADKADENRPLDYIHGTHMLLPKFEQEVEGKEPGDTFEFTLTPEEGYGTFDESRLVELPLEAFMIDGKVATEFLVVGRMIPMMSNTGQVVSGKVHSVGDKSVTMDFNHPMAGKTLNFSGKVIEVRDATEKELDEGLHGEYLPPEEGGKRCRKHGGKCHKEEGEGCCKEEGDGECCHSEGKDGEGCCNGGGCCKEKE